MIKNLKSRLSPLYWNLREKSSGITFSRLCNLFKGRMFDRKYDIDTMEILETEDLDILDDLRLHARKYRASKIDLVKKIMNEIPIKHEEFTFIDFGSGKGLCLMLAADYAFKRIIGIEVSPQLHKTAQENLRKYRSATGKGNCVELICTDARDFDIPPEKTLFYFYNPFDSLIMASVLANIRKSLDETPREIFLVYVVPSCAELIEAADFLRLETTAVMYGDRYSIYSNNIRS